MTAAEIEQLMQVIYQYGISEIDRELRSYDLQNTVVIEFSINTEGIVSYVRGEFDNETGAFSLQLFDNPEYTIQKDVTISGTITNSNISYVVKDINTEISISFSTNPSGAFQMNVTDSNGEEYGGTFNPIEGQDGKWDCETTTDLGVDNFVMEIDKRGNIIRFERH